MKKSKEPTSTIVETYMIIPPDGGWGWVITLVSFCCNIVADGVMYTFGIFLFDVAESLDVLSATVALTNSTMTAAYFLGGPLFCALINKFGYRSVSFFGALMAGAAHEISSWTNSVYVLIFILGIFGGTGFGMMYVPSVIAIGTYFEKWRAVANSISTTGSAVGIIVFPPIFSNLLQHLHWRQKFRILGAACFVCCLLSLLYRPLHPIKVIMEGEDTYSISQEGRKKKVYPTAAQVLEAIEQDRRAATSGGRDRRVSVQVDEKKWYAYKCLCCHCGRSAYPPARPFYRDDIFYTPLKKLGLYRDTGRTGDLTFDSFTLGRFVSFTSDGCPDGALQITESNRPHVGGSWCGTSWGPAIYYSETKSVTITVSLLRLSKDQSGYNFDFRMEYKLLKKTAATVRYGGGSPYFFPNTTMSTVQPEPEYYLGDLITGTYCSRIFSDCDRKDCRLQSPNFPGLYPRNVTCYYAVRQHEIPEGRHALITVRQSKGQLISIRSQSALYGTASSRELKVWNACDDVQDYVTVYDGYTTRDPVILKFCGGGEAVPEAVSSGHELLVEFSTSPYGTFLHPTPIQSLHGFQLEVEVKFVDQQSPTFVKNKRNCEFWIRGTNKGVLESPLHTLPANTTCLYHLQGMDTSVSPSSIPFRPPSRYPDGIWRQTRLLYPPPRYRVWLSVIKFHVAGTRDLQKQDTEMCRSSLKVWDGQVYTGTICNDLFCSSKDKSKNIPKTSLSGPLGTTRNVTLLARYCREHIPRTCDHSMLANNTRFPRPCSLAESFLSSGDSLTLELQISDSTALRPVKFRALYEFVDLHQDGEPYGLGPCSRKFTIVAQNTQQRFQAPRDIFMYGRGGAKNISCIYRFEAQKDEKVKITLTQLLFKNRTCQTRLSPDSDRLQCYGNTSATVRFFEVPWDDVPPVPRDCLCSRNGGTHLPFTYISTSNVVELRFDVTGMNSSDDFTTLFFEGTWKFIRTPACSRNLRMQGPSGEIAFQFPSESPDELNCENYPRVIIPSPKKYLYVKINGIILRHSSKHGNETSVPPIRCGTSNRITVHTAMYSAVICPYSTSSRHNLVEVFSEGWSMSSVNDPRLLPVEKIEIDYLGQDLSRTIVVEFLGKEPGVYSVWWLELSRRRIIPPNGLGLLWIKADECQYRCPELDACINASVWCDGIEDCPSGIDEALTHCSLLLQLPPLYLFLGALGILLSSVATCAIAWKRCRRRPRSFLQTRLRSLSSDTAIIDEKGVIC